jgi:hypothetical protein
MANLPRSLGFLGAGASVQITDSASRLSLGNPPLSGPSAGERPDRLLLAYGHEIE